jgi:hypothetical protein
VRLSDAWSACPSDVRIDPPPHEPAGVGIDDGRRRAWRRAQQAADDALVAVLAKLPEFRGDSLRRQLPEDARTSAPEERVAARSSPAPAALTRTAAHLFWIRC